MTAIRGRLALIAGVVAPLGIAAGIQIADPSPMVSLACIVGAAGVAVALVDHAERKSRALTALLDHVEQGFVHVHADGTLAAPRSALATQLLGTYQRGQRIWEALAAHDPATAAWLDLCWTSALENGHPVGRSIEELPCELTSRDRSYRLEYRPADDARGDLLVVITDKTAERVRDHAAAAERDLLRMIERMARDRSWFVDLLDELGGLIDKLQAAAGARVSPALRRELHTLKGNCGLIGLAQIAGWCHDLEERAAATKAIDGNLVRTIADAFAALKTKLAQVSIAAPPSDVSQEDLAELRAAMAHGASLGMIDHLIRSWALERTRPRLERFAEQAHSLADRLGKATLEVEIDDHAVRLDPVRFRTFWAAFAHAVRNAVDHGVETTAERIAAGKPVYATLQMSTRCEASAVVIEIHDDGRGVDWDALRVRAREALRPHATHNDLVAAMFSDGITTRSDVTETSGRGVGLAALRDACVSLGGEIHVESERGKGTRMRFTLPLARRERITSKIPRSFAATTRLRIGSGTPGPAGTAPQS